MKPSNSSPIRQPIPLKLKRLTRVGLVSLVALAPAILAAQTAEDSRLTAITDKLDAVHVYYLERESGQRYTVDAGPDKPAVSPVFFYEGSAQSLRDDLLLKEPPVETGVVRVGLGEIYMSIQDLQSSDVHYALISDPWQVSEARRVNEDENFNETPIFAVQMKGKDGFLSMKNTDGTPLLPLFVESQRALAAVDIMVQQNPDMKGGLAVSALPLSTAVSDMVNGRLDVESVIFIPPQ